MSEYTIRTGAQRLGVSEQYLRKCIREGKIQTNLVQVGTSGKVKRHEITEAELMKFQKRTSVRTSRDDGRNKFVIYLSKTEEVRIRKMLKDNKLDNINQLLSRANPSKSTK